jgi:hypothetical protein
VRRLPGQVLDVAAQAGVTAKLVAVHRIALAGEAGRVPGGDTSCGAELARAGVPDGRRPGRVAAGARAKALDGRWPSSPQGAPFGYKVVGTKRDARLVISETEQATILKAAELVLDEGRSATEAAAILNSLGLPPRGSLRKQDGVTVHVPARWSAHLLRHHLTRRALMADVQWGTGRFAARRPDGSLLHGGGVVVQGVPPVLTEDRFRAPGEALQEHDPVHVPGLVYSLSNRIESACGRSYTGIYRSDRELRSYRCQGKHEAPSCRCPWFDADWLEQEVWSRVAASLADPDWFTSMASEYLAIGADKAVTAADELQEIKARIAQRETRLQSDVAAYLRAGIEAEAVASASRELQEELAVLRVRRDAIERMQSDLSAQAGALDDAARLARQAEGQPPSFGPEQQASLIRQLDLHVRPSGPGRRPELEIRGRVPLDGRGLLPNATGSTPDGCRSSIEA